MWPPLNRVETEFIGVTRKERPCFAAEHGLDRLGPTSPGLLGAHERNGAVLLQNATPTPLGTHEHSRVHFLILRSGLPLLNGVGAEFIGVTRKERPCFAAERGLDRLGPTSLRMVYWGHTKGTAPFCCRMRPRPPLGTHQPPHVPFSDPKIPAPSTKSSWCRIYWIHTKRTALFCCRTWP